LYRKISTGEVRGREDWQLTSNLDGSRTLRAVATTDDSRFLRDTTYTIDSEGRPTDVFVRLHVGDRWIGTGYFRREGNRLHVVTDRAGYGRDEQSLDIPDRLHIVTHAVMLDGWTLWPYDLARGGRQTVTVYNTSTRWDGTEGPLGRLEEMEVECLGEEPLETKTGRQVATLFTIDSDTMDSPTCRLWVAGSDRILLRYEWVDFDLEYVLERWSRERGEGEPA